MKKTLARDLTVGAVVLGAAFILTIGIFSIGSQQNVWVRKVAYHLRIPDANGLAGGSPVRLAGVQVGAVTGIHFPEDPNLISIDVDLAVDQAHQHRIRQDTVANLRILTLLGGERYVELTPGNPALPVLPPGSYVKVPESFGMEQLGELSAGLADDLRSISGNVRIILETVQRQEGVVGRMLLDPNFGREIFNDLGATAKLAKETVQEIHDGKGMAGRLLADEQFARETTESIRQSLQDIRSLMARVTQEGGVVDQALDPNGKLARSMDNIERATSELQGFTSDLKEGQGTLGRLISDERYAEELLANIKRISENLAAITSKLNEGEGTLGGMINDPELYEDIKDVVRGVKDSKFLSWLIRHYRERGEKEKVKEEGGKNATEVPAPKGGM